MPSNYVITEPSPSTTSYMRSGRGGAGNTFRAPATAPTTHIIPSTVSKPSSTGKTSRFFSGIGGAGNAHEAHERPSPAALVDEEVRRAAARESHLGGAAHCGIGGAGNVYRRKASDASVESDAMSETSQLSIKEKLWRRVSGSFSRD